MRRGPKPTLTRAQLLAALARHAHSVPSVAREAGISRQAVYIHMQHYKIRRRLSRAQRSERMRLWWAERKFWMKTA